MKLSEKIIRLRKSRGMSQEALAEALGISRQAVSRWEQGSALPDASNLLQLSRLFGVSADYLLHEEYEDEADCRGPGERTKRRAARTLGWCAVGFGLLGNFAIYVLSRFIEVMVPHVTRVNGETWYTYSSSITGRSYEYFIQEYKLEFLVALFWIMTAAGFLLAFVPKEKLTKPVGKLKDFLKGRIKRKSIPPMNDRED